MKIIFIMGIPKKDFSERAQKIIFEGASYLRIYW
jgi:hypothetical protein